MKIIVQNLAKRYNREQIFNDFHYTFVSGEKYAITGSNGSGKSTLLQLISGATLPSSGSIIYEKFGEKIDANDIYRDISFAAPYIELIEEFTLMEQLAFHFKFKQKKGAETLNSIVKKALFTGHEHKYIKNFSSGMKQRLKLALAFFSDTPILLLDEPTTNLDDNGVLWYKDNMSSINHRLVILASNSTSEYEGFNKKILISSYK